MTENKVEALPDLDDLLQCPVCYEIPSGQIFQCNEGHHVCGRCKMRLDVCPVCRAFFFGTRNYAMEELIANVKKLQAFKLGGKVTTGSPPEVEEAAATAAAPETVAPSSSEDNESSTENANETDMARLLDTLRAPATCKGLFRCLCCKINPERLPLARLLNHLRYYHSPDLIEGRSENGTYLQAWQFPTAPGRLVTAVRVHDMGIFFLVIEVTYESVHAWMSMAASPSVAQEFSYSFTLSGNDREAIFSDCVWSVRACEGSLKSRRRCLSVSGESARALLTPSAMSGKLSVRRLPRDVHPQPVQPRAVLRVANRSAGAQPAEDVAHDLEPFLQDLQNDVARLSRAFATLGREANALVRSEAEMRARLEHAPEHRAAPAEPQPPVERAEPQMSRSARRRMRMRLREAFLADQAFEEAAATRPSPGSVAATRPTPGPAAATRPTSGPAAPARPTAGTTVTQRLPRPTAASSIVAINRLERPERSLLGLTRPNVLQPGSIGIQPALNENVSRPQNQDARVNINQPMSANTASVNGPNSNPRRANATQHSRADNEPPPTRLPAPVAPPPVPPPAFGGPSQERPANGNARNKRKRRHRR